MHDAGSRLAKCTCNMRRCDARQRREIGSERLTVVQGACTKQQVLGEWCAAAEREKGARVVGGRKKLVASGHKRNGKQQKRAAGDRRRATSYRLQVLLNIWEYKLYIEHVH